MVVSILRRLRPSERTSPPAPPRGKLEKLSLSSFSSWLLGQVQVTIGRYHSRIRGLEIEHAISTLPIIPHFAIAILLLILPNWLGRGNKVEKACWGGGEKPRSGEFEDADHPCRNR